MAAITEKQSEARAIEIFNYIDKKIKFCNQKCDKAKGHEQIDHWYDKLKLYRKFSIRCNDLIFSIRKNEKFGTGRYWWEQSAEEWIRNRKEKKAIRRLKFESNFHFAPHFLQESLSADYGTFECDRCGSTFYHSPSDVYQGKDKKHSSCCGHCVNSLCKTNGQEEIFF